MNSLTDRHRGENSKYIQVSVKKEQGFTASTVLFYPPCLSQAFTFPEFTEDSVKTNNELRV